MDKSSSIQSKSKEGYLILVKWSKFHISVKIFMQKHTGFLAFFGASGLEILLLLIIKNANNRRVVSNENGTAVVKRGLVTEFHLII